MCFTLYTEKQPKPKRAKKDIKVYKGLGYQDGGVYWHLYIKGKYERWTRGFHYTETTPFASLTRSVFDNTLWNIKGHAFHSCKTRKEVSRVCGPSLHSVVTMVIPKGALYFENKTQYASSEIIFL